MARCQSSSPGRINPSPNSINKPPIYTVARFATFIPIVIRFSANSFPALQIAPIPDQSGVEFHVQAYPRLATKTVRTKNMHNRVNFGEYMPAAKACSTKCRPGLSVAKNITVTAKRYKNPPNREHNHRTCSIFSALWISTPRRTSSFSCHIVR